MRNWGILNWLGADGLVLGFELSNETLDDSIGGVDELVLVCFGLGGGVEEIVPELSCCL